MLSVGIDVVVTWPIDADTALSFWVVGCGSVPTRQQRVHAHRTRPDTPVSALHGQSVSKRESERGERERDNEKESEKVCTWCLRRHRVQPALVRPLSHAHVEGQQLKSQHRRSKSIGCGVLSSACPSAPFPAMVSRNAQQSCESGDIHERRAHYKLLDTPVVTQDAPPDVTY